MLNKYWEQYKASKEYHDIKTVFKSYGTTEATIENILYNVFAAGWEMKKPSVIVKNHRTKGEKRKARNNVD